MLTKQLDLTPDQVTQIKGIYADEGTQMKALHEDTSMAQTDKRQKMFSIRKDSHEKFLGVLTPDQKTKLEAFKAKMRSTVGSMVTVTDRVRGPSPPPAPSL